MRVARASRGFSSRSVRAWPALAASTGALFIRSYERGERVHLAMLARGYDGRMPTLSSDSTSAAQVVRCAVLPVAALAVLLVARFRLGAR
jgi:cobalt/nickel transport system permease protein